MLEVEKNSQVTDCVGVLGQWFALLERLNDRLGSDIAGLPDNSGVGSHLRRCPDFYQN